MVLNMKKLYMLIALLPIFAMGIGCTSTCKLPSLTLGGAANKKALVGASLGKEGLSVTAPLVDLDVPFPTASVDK